MQAKRSTSFSLEHTRLLYISFKAEMDEILPFHLSGQYLNFSWVYARISYLTTDSRLDIGRVNYWFSRHDLPLVTSSLSSSQLDDLKGILTAKVDNLQVKLLERLRKESDPIGLERAIDRKWAMFENFELRPPAHGSPGH